MKNVLDFFCSGQKVRVNFINDGVIKVTRYLKGDAAVGQGSYAIVGEANESENVQMVNKDGVWALKTNRLQVSVNLASTNTKQVSIRFEDACGNLLLEEQLSNISCAEAVFDVPNGTDYYGLGQQPNNAFGYRDKSIRLKHENTSIAIPFLVTDGGFGLFWDNSGAVDVDFTEPGIMRWSSDTGNSVDYYFLYGPSINEIIQHYWNLTGPASLLPRCAYGYWQSKMRYTSQQELLDVATVYREKGYPADILVIDYFHWTQMGDFRFDSVCWPKPEAMFGIMKKLHFEGMVSVWPFISEKSMNYLPMKQSKMLVCNDKGDAIPFTNFSGELCGLYDPFNPMARAYVWEKARKYLEQGASIWWLDSCEPDVDININDFVADGIQTDQGPLAERINAYALMHARTFYDGQRKDYPNKRVLILARSAFAGSQRYGTTVWSGDIACDFETLKTQIIAGLNVTMSGLPFWTTDIGGFRGGNPDDPKYRELYVRWFQYGAFCPIFRAHGGRGATNMEDLNMGVSRSQNELWSYGQDQEPILVKYDRLRYRLLPYIYSSARATLITGTPFMRALIVDFTDDRKVRSVLDQFMFGKAIMVCPVTDAGAASRLVYLPEGCDWYDYWTKQRYAGGQTIYADAPIDKIPLYVRAGSIIPMGPDIEYTGEKGADEIELQVYSGADTSFELYEDDGETYEYEKGKYSLSVIYWDDQASRVDIMKKHEGYVGTKISYKVNVIL